MSKEKRGGSRLEKNMPKKSQQTKQTPSKQGPVTSGTKAAGDVPHWLKVLLIVLAVVAVLLLAAFLVDKGVKGFRSWASLPDIPDPPNDITLDVDNEIPKHMSNATRKEQFYTFLVAGKDTGGGGNTDTMMLVAYDIPNQRLSIMSLPRDTMVDARHPDQNRKLNGVWNLGLYYAKKDEKKAGVEYLKEAVGDMIGFVPDFYVTVNWEAFGRLVDTIGGVEFDVPRNMNYDDTFQSLHIHVNKGKQLLNGEQAMGVIRWRQNNDGSGYANGDLGRIQTQQALVKEIIKKVLRIENLTKINSFAAIFAEEVDTDLTLGNLVAFAEKAISGGLDMDNVLFSTMPYEERYVGRQSYVQAKPDELLGILNDSFNPYKEDIPMEALHILQYSSSTGYYIYSGTGTGTTPVYTGSNPNKGSGSTGSNAQQSKPPVKDPDGSASPSPSASPGASSSPSSRPNSTNNSEEPDDPDVSASHPSGNDPAPSKEVDPPATEDPPQSEQNQPQSGGVPQGIPAA